jgi:hypothetical protein
LNFILLDRLEPMLEVLEQTVGYVADVASIFFGAYPKTLSPCAGVVATTIE